MDGLLLDTEIIYTQVTQRIVGAFGKEFNWSIKSNMIGLPSLESARYLVEALSLPIKPEDYLRQRDAFLRAAFPSCQALPGAQLLVNHLAVNRVPIAVATSSSREFYDLKTEQHPWFSLFNAVVTADNAQVKHGKPAPDIFLYAAQVIGAQPQSTLVFEDAPSGLAAAKAAGMRAVVVPNVNMDKSRYTGADLIIDNLLEFKPEAFGLPGLGRAN